MRRVRVGWVLGSAVLIVLVVGGGFVALVTWATRADDPAILTQELADLPVPAGANASPIRLHPCEGDGSFPPSADRTIESESSVEALKQAITHEATQAGWQNSTNPDDEDRLIFDRSGRSLDITLTATENGVAQAEVHLFGISLMC